jgi:formamidopyrimidine-DNA glycosylase
MAEVPEVEILTRGLREAVVERTLLGANVLLPAAVRFPAVEEFTTTLTNRTVLGARRWAKHILLSLSGDLVLEMHMMLWGTLTLVPCAQPRVPETMVIWLLDRDEELRLTDKLGYARVALGPPDAVAERLDLHSLGPDALDPTYDTEVLAQRLIKRRGVLKTVLLNQRVFAGLGNRDADESLWLARIDPRRPVTSLTSDEITHLHTAMQKVLSEGLALGGTQRDIFGRKGQALHGQYVFERVGKPCPRCHTPVTHVRISGRNTYYCSNCQQ